MTEDKIFRGLIALGFVATVFVGLTQADTGHEGAARIERGSYGQTRVISLSSATGTLLWPASTKRPDSICVKNSAAVIWLGTTTVASLVGVQHPNIAMGLPWVGSSATFKLDGSYTGGDLAATCDAQNATCEVRCLDGLVP